MQYGSYYENTREAPHLNTKVKKMADSWFALSSQKIVEQFKENAKNKNTLKATHLVECLVNMGDGKKN